MYRVLTDNFVIIPFNFYFHTNYRNPLNMYKGHMDKVKGVGSRVGGGDGWESIVG